MTPVHAFDDGQMAIIREAGRAAAQEAVAAAADLLDAQVSAKMMTLAKQEADVAVKGHAASCPGLAFWKIAAVAGAGALGGGSIVTAVSKLPMFGG